MISVAFTASKTSFGGVIRKLTGQRVSHTFAEYDCSTLGGRWAMEAHAPGVRVIPAKKARKNVVAYFSCKFDASAALKKIAHKVGQRYDIGGLFVFVWFILLTRVLGRKFKKPLNNTGGQFCSELVARMFMAAGLPDTSMWDPELKTPGDLRIYCLEHPELFDQVPADKLPAA